MINSPGLKCDKQIVQLETFCSLFNAVCQSFDATKPLITINKTEFIKKIVFKSKYRFCHIPREL